MRSLVGVGLGSACWPRHQTDKGPPVTWRDAETRTLLLLLAWFRGSLFRANLPYSRTGRSQVDEGWCGSGPWAACWRQWLSGQTSPPATPSPHPLFAPRRVGGALLEPDSESAHSHLRRRAASPVVPEGQEGAVHERAGPHERRQDLSLQIWPAASRAGRPALPGLRSGVSYKHVCWRKPLLSVWCMHACVLWGGRARMMRACVSTWCSINACK